MNPCSKVFDVEELDFIAGLCLKHDAYAICDEVYEHIIFDDRRHVSLMTRPGMRDRTARIGSAGKSFSLTGWKVGYVTAAPGLMKPIAKTHQFMTFTTPPNLQWGAAVGLRLGDGYFSGLALDMQRKRDRLAGALSSIGFDVLPAHGTYFVTTDFRPLGFNGTDEDFCRHITVEAGVTAVPVSAFFDDSGRRRGTLRVSASASTTRPWTVPSIAWPLILGGPLKTSCSLARRGCNCYTSLGFHFWQGLCVILLQ